MKKTLLFVSILFILGLIPINDVLADYWGMTVPGPVLINFSPEIISPGQEVIITGYDFGDDGSRADVYFYDQPAIIISWSDTEIIVNAPLEFATNSDEIEVRGYFFKGLSYVGNGTYKDGYEYFVETIGDYKVRPEIESVTSSDINPYMKLVKIEGKYFGQIEKEVLFGDTKATVSSWNPDIIYVVLPDNANQPITVKISDGLTDTIQYHYLNPAPDYEGVLTSVSPSSINSGETFTLYGYYMSDDDVIKLVSTSDEYAVPSNAVEFMNSNVIKVTIPEDVSLSGIFSVQLLAGNLKTSELLNALTLNPSEIPIDTDTAVINDSDSVSNEDVIVREKSLAVNKDINLTKKLKGKILLQVESVGEAWYIHPDEEKKFYMKDGATAYQMLREFGLGITNADLEKIPIEGSDQTGDYSLVNKLKGYILLQVEENGEAWYVNPDNGQRYYLKDGAEAYRIMRELSLGITNNDLRKIEVGEL